MKKRRSGPRSAYGPKVRQVNVRFSAHGGAALDRGTSSTGLSEGDWLEAKARGEDPAVVAERLRAEEEASSERDRTA